MPVLVEAINVILRNETIAEKYPGGMGNFWIDSPNSSLCADDCVTRIGFIGWEMLRGFIDRLVEVGFVFVGDGEFIEIAIVDQADGLLRPCRWLNVGDHPDGFRYTAMCGDLSEVIEKPLDWRFEDSITEQGWSRRLDVPSGSPESPSEDPFEELFAELLEEPVESQGRVNRFEVSPPPVSPEAESISDESIEDHRRQLIAVHGDTVRQVWRVEPYGQSYPIGEVRIRDIPEMQVTDPESCYLIAAVGERERIGVVMPATGAGIEALSPSQRFALVWLPKMGAIKGPGPRRHWWNPWHWCRKWLGIGTS